LTEKSAALVKEHGFMASKQNPDENHLMIPGLSGVGKWLQTEHDGAPLLANPAAVSTLSGILARAATQQNMAEVVDYLKTIDHKLDDVLRKVDDAQVTNMVGVADTIERAWAIREETRTVNETLWSTVDQSFQAIAATQAYALGQLDAIAIKLEDTKVGDLARAAALAKTDVPKWLGVLAQCFRLQDAVEMIELDRVLAESPAELDAYRLGLQKAKQQRRDLISDHTFQLLSRMEAAVTTANAKMIWNRTLCREEASGEITGLGPRAAPSSPDGQPDQGLAASRGATPLALLLSSGSPEHDRIGYRYGRRAAGAGGPRAAAVRRRRKRAVSAFRPSAPSGLPGDAYASHVVRRPAHRFCRRPIHKRGKLGSGRLLGGRRRRRQ
jgi:hypothetical protein